MSGDARAPRRPAVHVSAPGGWLNDPNGLCYHQGVWHAYYQYAPHDDVPGNMHWGHATSADLIRWVDQPVALRPGPLGVVFSGSVVVDVEDTAGSGPDAMVAMFTHHRRGRECQSIAVSTDGGYTWTQDPANPILVADRPDFRDPKVWRTDGDPAWAMCLAAGRAAWFYRSADLRRWSYTGEYLLPDDLAGTVECPDVVDFGVGSPQALMFSVSSEAGDGGTYTAIGRYDGTRFVAEGEPAVLDRGPDFYASQSVHGALDGPLVLGWMGNWRTSPHQPSTGRRGALSFPRRLALRPAMDGGPELVQRFAAAPWASSTLHGVHHSSEPDRALHVTMPVGSVLAIRDVRRPVVEVTTDSDEVRIWRDDPIDGEVVLVEPLLAAGVEVLIDHGTLELVANDGATWISACYFAGAEWSLTVSDRAQVREVRR